MALLDRGVEPEDGLGGEEGEAEEGERGELFSDGLVDMADEVDERRPEEAEDDGAEEAERDELPAREETLEAGRDEAGVGLILCYPLLLLPSVFLSIRVFPNESAPHIRWSEY